MNKELNKQQKEDLEYIEKIYPQMREIQNQYNEINYYSTMLKFYDNSREDYEVNFRNFKRMSASNLGLGLVFFISYMISGLYKWAISAILIFVVAPFLWQTMKHDKQYNKFSNNTPQIIKVANEKLRLLLQNKDLDRIPKQYRYIVPLNFVNAALSRNLVGSLEEGFELFDEQVKTLNATRERVYPEIVLTSTEENLMSAEKEAIYINEVIDSIKLQHMKEGVKNDKSN